jgi:hypothetical protein
LQLLFTLLYYTHTKATKQEQKMKLTNKAAIELGKIIAQNMHEQSLALYKQTEYVADRRNASAARSGILDTFNNIGDAIESSEARILYCRSFRAELDRLEPLTRSAA